ncbi:Phage shock protein C (PspC) family protein [Tenacibaculum sp. 190524A02b]
MNKTININLGGFFFHIDEIAFQKLKRYLDAISRSLSDDPQGKEEIIADIEARISELLSERVTDVRQVVNEGDIDEIIAIMGQPEDYTEAEETYSDNTYYKSNRTSNSKKLFRNSEDKFLAGVCSGLGYYFNIDVIWIRLAFLILTLAGFGFGVIGYIILWVLLPEARTTAEKLQMEGEAVNISNIEKKIRTEFESLSAKVKEGAHELTDKISNADYDKLRNQTKSGAQDFIDTLGKILLAVFKVFGKFMGVLLLFIAGIALVSLILGMFSIGSLEVLNFDNEFNIPFLYDSLLPKWLMFLFFFILAGIPFLVLFILGLRILSPNIKKLNTTTVLTLLGLWLVALLGVGFSAIEYGTSKAYNGTHVEKHSLTYNTENPIKIRVINDDNLYDLGNLRNRDNAINVTHNDKTVKYSNDIHINVRKSETGNAYIKIKKTSEGRKRNKANKNAELIDYSFKTANNTLVFDAYFLSDLKNMRKDEEVKVTLYIPEGTTVYFERSSRNFLYNIENTEDIYDRDMANHKFKMTSEGFECTDCEKKQEKEEKEKTDDADIDYDDSVNENVSFLFDSTINNIKAELTITDETTEKQLIKLAKWFKKRKNIDIDFSESTFHENGKINTYSLKVNCNDGYKGKTTSKIIIRNGDEHGFIRSYDDESFNFKIW